MDVYGKDLIAEANRIAKRAKAERPSPEHVRQAADRIGILRDRAGAASDLAQAVGSIFIGGAVAFQVNLWTGGDAKGRRRTLNRDRPSRRRRLVVASAAVKWRRA
ncbi:hypothetical protein GCM10010531_15300 [Blastococcus jejuensis]|uniref:Uncharacterized protein n=1 Tax=Blastococcus jejuensis TaxID=351224 RepID=A0ABP6P0S2_9ACTN